MCQFSRKNKENVPNYIQSRSIMNVLLIFLVKMISRLPITKEIKRNEVISLVLVVYISSL